MHNVHYSNSSILFYRSRVFLLCICWLSGLLLGAYYSIKNLNFISPLIRGIVSFEFISLAYVLIFWIQGLLLGFVLSIHKSEVLFPYFFIIAFGYSIVVSAVFGTFHSAGLLINVFLFTPNLIFNLIGFLFCVYRLITGEFRSYRFVFAILIILTVSCLIEIYFAVPFYFHFIKLL